MATATATLKWSGNAASEVFNGTNITRRITRSYTIVDAASETEALAAIGLPIYNQEFKPGSPYRVGGREVRPEGGPSTWTAQIDYGVPDNGTWSEIDLDPLQRPTFIEWADEFSQVAKSTDANSARIANSAGDPFDPLPVQSQRRMILYASKWFPFFDMALPRTFANTYNSAAYTLQDMTLLPGEILCQSIAPMNGYELVKGDTTKSLVQLRATFAIDFSSRPPAASSGQPKSGYPFDHHLVDQGLLGWYTGADGFKKRGRFCYVEATGANRMPSMTLTEPTLLDGKGKPIDATIKIAEPNPTGIPTKVADPVDAPSAYWTDTNPDLVSPFDKPGSIRQWRYAEATPANFSDLPF